MTWTDKTAQQEAFVPAVAPMEGNTQTSAAHERGKTPPENSGHPGQHPPRDFWQEYVHSLNFFLEDPRWLAKLWVLPLFFWVPVVNLFGWWLLKAWQIGAVRSIARGDGLPALNFSDILSNVFKRISIAITNFLFPVAIFWVTGLSGPLDWWEDIQLIWQLKGWEFFIGFLQELVIVFVVTYIWTAISSCIIQSGIIRWTVSGKWTVALNPVGNLWFFIKNLHQFSKFYIYYLATLLLMSIVTMVLSLTVVGLLLWPVITSWYATSVAHELGHLAQKVAAKKGVRIP